MGQTPPNIRTNSAGQQWHFQSCFRSGHTLLSKSESTAGCSPDEGQICFSSGSLEALFGEEATLEGSQVWFNQTHCSETPSANSASCSCCFMFQELSCLCLASGPTLPPKPSRLEPRNTIHRMTGSIHPGSMPLAPSQDQSSGTEPE